MILISFYYSFLFQYHRDFIFIPNELGNVNCGGRVALEKPTDLALMDNVTTLYNIEW